MKSDCEDCVEVAKLNGEAGLGVGASVVLATPVPAEGKKGFGAEDKVAGLVAETSAALASLGAVVGKGLLAVDNNEAGD